MFRLVFIVDTTTTYSYYQKVLNQLINIVILFYKFPPCKIHFNYDNLQLKVSNICATLLVLMQQSRDMLISSFITKASTVTMLSSWINLIISKKSMVSSKMISISSWHVSYFQYNRKSFLISKSLISPFKPLKLSS